MTLKNSGRLGVGTQTPQASMEIYTESDDHKCGLILNQTHATVSTNEIRFRRNDTTTWAIGSHINDDHPKSFFIWNHTQGLTNLCILQNGYVGLSTLNPSSMLDVNGAIEAQRMGIGTNPPGSGSSYKVYVEGGIMAREVKVTANNFPDYVFSSNHQRLTINQLADYVDRNHRLPGMPSAGEVMENEGFELGDMQVRLLEKVEEQALYIIELQRQIDELRSLLETSREDRP